MVTRIRDPQGNVHEVPDGMSPQEYIQRVRRDQGEDVNKPGFFRGAGDTLAAGGADLGLQATGILSQLDTQIRGAGLSDLFGLNKIVGGEDVLREGITAQVRRQKKAVAEAESRMAPEAIRAKDRAAAAQIEDPSTWGAFLEAAPGMALRSAPGTAVGIGAGIAMRNPMAAFATEGLISLGATDISVRDEIEQIAANTPNEFVNSTLGAKYLTKYNGQYWKAVDAASDEAARIAAPIVAAQTVALAKLIGRQEAMYATGAIRQSVIKAALSGAVGEGLEEAAQSAAERIVQTISVNRARTSQVDPLEGAPEAAVQGFLAGGLMGGPTTAAGQAALNLSQRNRQQPEEAPLPEDIPIEGAVPDQPDDGLPPEPEAAPIELPPLPEPPAYEPPREEDGTEAERAAIELIRQRAREFGVPDDIDITNPDSIPTFEPDPPEEAEGATRTYEPVPMYAGVLAPGEALFDEETQDIISGVVADYAARQVPLDQSPLLDIVQRAILNDPRVSGIRNEEGEVDPYFYPFNPNVNDAEAEPVGYGIKITDTLPDGTQRVSYYDPLETETEEQAREFIAQKFGQAAAPRSAQQPESIKEPPAPVEEKPDTSGQRYKPLPKNPVPENLSTARAKTADGIRYTVEPVEADEVIENDWPRADPDEKMEIGPDTHVWLKAPDGNRQPVRKDIFENTYLRNEDGTYSKDPSKPVRFYVAPERQVIKTAEYPRGGQIAEPGDYVVMGPAGEMWPVKPEKFTQRYDVEGEASKKDPLIDKPKVDPTVVAEEKGRAPDGLKGKAALKKFDDLAKFQINTDEDETTYRKNVADFAGKLTEDDFRALQNWAKERGTRDEVGLVDDMASARAAKKKEKADNTAEIAKAQKRKTLAEKIVKQTKEARLPVESALREGRSTAERGNYSAADTEALLTSIRKEWARAEKPAGEEPRPLAATSPVAKDAPSLVPLSDLQKVVDRVVKAHGIDEVDLPGGAVVLDEDSDSMAAGYHKGEIFISALVAERLANNHSPTEIMRQMAALSAHELFHAAMRARVISEKDLSALRRFVSRARITQAEQDVAPTLPDDNGRRGPAAYVAGKTYLSVVRNVSYKNNLQASDMLRAYRRDEFGNNYRATLSPADREAVDSLGTPEEKASATYDALTTEEAIGEFLRLQALLYAEGFEPRTTIAKRILDRLVAMVQRIAREWRKSFGNDEQKLRAAAELIAQDFREGRLMKRSPRIVEEYDTMIPLAAAAPKKPTTYNTVAAERVLKAAENVMEDGKLPRGYREAVSAATGYAPGSVKSMMSWARSGKYGKAIQDRALAIGEASMEKADNLAEKILTAATALVARKVPLSAARIAEEAGLDKKLVVQVTSSMRRGTGASTYTKYHDKFTALEKEGRAYKAVVLKKDIGQPRNESYDPDGIKLTPQQRRMVEMARNGYSNEQIADLDDTTEDVVRTQLKAAKQAGAEFPSGHLRAERDWDIVQRAVRGELTDQQALSEINKRRDLKNRKHMTKGSYGSMKSQVRAALKRQGGEAMPLAAVAPEAEETDPFSLYSAVEKAARSYKPTRPMNRKNMLKWLAAQPGVKTEEMRALELDAWAGQGSTGTKEDLLNWIDKHRVMLHVERAGSPVEVVENIENFGGKRLPSRPVGNTAEFQEYTVRGEQTPMYRTMAIFDPRFKWADAHIGPPGTLAHVRYTTVDNDDGTYDMHVEEFQSDYHDAKSEDYADISAATAAKNAAEERFNAALREAREKLAPEWVVSDVGDISVAPGYENAEISDERDAVAEGEMNKLDRAAVELGNFELGWGDITEERDIRAPYRDTWPEMAFRIALQEALKTALADPKLRGISWNTVAGVTSIPGMTTYKGTLYDTRIPNYARKIAKPFGVKVEKVSWFPRPGGDLEVTEDFLVRVISDYASDEGWPELPENHEAIDMDASDFAEAIIFSVREWEEERSISHISKKWKQAAKQYFGDLIDPAKAGYNSATRVWVNNAHARLVEEYEAFERRSSNPGRWRFDIPREMVEHYRDAGIPLFAVAGYGPSSPDETGFYSAVARSWRALTSDERFDNKPRTLKQWSDEIARRGKKLPNAPKKSELKYLLTEENIRQIFPDLPADGLLAPETIGALIEAKVIRLRMIRREARAGTNAAKSGEMRYPPYTVRDMDGRAAMVTGRLPQKQGGLGVQDEAYLPEDVPGGTFQDSHDFSHYKALVNRGNMLGTRYSQRRVKIGDEEVDAYFIENAQGDLAQQATSIGEKTSGLVRMAQRLEDAKKALTRRMIYEGEGASAGPMARAWVMTAGEGGAIADLVKAIEGWTVKDWPEVSEFREALKAYDEAGGKNADFDARSVEPGVPEFARDPDEAARIAASMILYKAAQDEMDAVAIPTADLVNVIQGNIGAEWRNAYYEKVLTGHLRKAIRQFGGTDIVEAEMSFPYPGDIKVEDWQIEQLNKIAQTTGISVPVSDDGTVSGELVASKIRALTALANQTTNAKAAQPYEDALGKLERLLNNAQRTVTMEKGKVLVARLDEKMRQRILDPEKGGFPLWAVTGHRDEMQRAENVGYRGEDIGEGREWVALWNKAYKSVLDGKPLKLYTEEGRKAAMLDMGVAEAREELRNLERQIRAKRLEIEQQGDQEPADVEKPGAPLSGKIGDIVATYEHPELGRIVLPRGGKKWGYLHIKDKHWGEDRPSFGAIPKMRVVRSTDNGKYIEISDGETLAVIATDFAGEKKNWIVTAYKMVGAEGVEPSSKKDISLPPSTGGRAEGQTTEDRGENKGVSRRGFLGVMGGAAVAAAGGLPSATAAARRFSLTPDGAAARKFIEYIVGLDNDSFAQGFLQYGNKEAYPSLTDLITYGDFEDTHDVILDIARSAGDRIVTAEEADWISPQLEANSSLDKLRDAASRANYYEQIKGEDHEKFGDKRSYKDEYDDAIGDYDRALEEVVNKYGPHLNKLMRSWELRGLQARLEWTAKQIKLKSRGGEQSTTSDARRFANAYMSTAERMARAEKMGFKVRLWHTTADQNFSNFEDRGYIGHIGPGIYFWTDRAAAEATGRVVIPVLAKGPVVVVKNQEEAIKARNSGASVISLDASYKNPMAAVQSAANIRSIHAAFDEDRAAEPLILAAVAGMPSGKGTKGKKTRGYTPPAGSYGSERSVTVGASAPGDIAIPGYRDMIDYAREQVDAIPTQTIMGETVRKYTKLGKDNPLSTVGGLYDYLDRQGEAILRAMWSKGFAMMPWLGRLIKGYVPMGELPHKTELMVMRSVAAGVHGKSQDLSARLAQAVAKAGRMPIRDALAVISGQTPRTEIDRQVAEDMEALRGYLTNAEPEVEQGFLEQISNDELRAVAVEVKQTIDQVGQLLVQQKFMHPKQYARWKGRYLRRMYMLYFESYRQPGGLGMSGVTYNRARKSIPRNKKIEMGEIRDLPFLIYYSLQLPLSDMARAAYMNSVMVYGLENPETGWVLPESFVQYGGNTMSLFSLAESQKFVKGELQRKEIEIKRLGGEKASGAAVKILISHRDELARQIEEMQKLLDAHPEYAAAIDKGLLPDGYVQIPLEPRRYAEMAGGIVHKDIAADIKGSGELTINQSDEDWIADAKKNLRGYNSTVKFLWTVANPATQFRNFYSNIITLPQSGTNAFQVFKAVAALYQHYGKKQPHLGVQALLDHGGTKQTFTEADLRAFNEFADKVRIAEERAQRKEKMSGLLAPIHQAVTAAAVIRQAVKDVYGNPASFMYQWGDVLFKVAKTIDSMERGMPPAIAAMDAADWYFDHSNAPPIIKTLRNSGVAPFVGWAYFSFGRTAVSLGTAPWRLLGRLETYMLLTSLFTISVMGGGSDGDDDGEVGLNAPDVLATWWDVNKNLGTTEEEKGVRKTLSTGLQKRPMLIPLPWRDSLGRQQYFDMSSIDIGAQAVQATQAGARADPVAAMQALSFTGGPIFSLAAFAMTGIDGTGRVIFEPDDPQWRKNKEIAQFALEMHVPSTYAYYMPPVLSPTGGAGYEAVFGTGKMRDGAPSQIVDQLVPRVAGVNVYPVDVPRAWMIRSTRLQRKIEDVMRDRTRHLKDAQFIDPDTGALTDRGERRLKELDAELARARKELEDFRSDTALALALEMEYQRKRTAQGRN